MDLIQEQQKKLIGEVRDYVRQNIKTLTQHSLLQDLITSLMQLQLLS